MPLHDWNALPGWEGVHLYWLTGIARWLKGHLPPDYRAVVGSSPMVGVDLPQVKPDVGVQTAKAPDPSTAPATPAALVSVEAMQPDLEVAVDGLAEDNSVLVEYLGRLVAAVELVSPRNKDRPASRVHFGARYLSYLKNGVHLALIDVHPRPQGFGFGSLIAEEFKMPAPPFVAPQALSYRVGEPAATGGRLLGVWQRALTAGQPLPSLPLALREQQLIVLDLESTYQQATADAYVE
jgi:hypothetical protein